jgi:membrane protein
MNFKTIWGLLRQTFDKWNDHDAPRVGAALAFYALLSMAPLVILLISILALFLGRPAAQAQLLSQAESLMGRQGSEAVKGMLDQGQKPASGTMATVLSAVALLFGASGVFSELQSALNDMWDVESEDAGGVWRTIKQRLFSIGMVVAAGFLLLVSLSISAALVALAKYHGGLPRTAAFVWAVLDFVVSFAGISVLFGLVFRYVPSKRIRERSNWIGAAVTALLFTAGKSLIGLYLGKAAVGSAYGAAESLVVVMVWAYYSAMIFLFGAEFTHVLDAAGSRQEVRPSG